MSGLRLLPSPAPPEAPRMLQLFCHTDLNMKFPFPSLLNPLQRLFLPHLKHLRLQGASSQQSPLFVSWVMQVSTFPTLMGRLSRAGRVQSIKSGVINSCHRPSQQLWSTGSWLQLLLLMMKHQGSCLYLNFPFQFSDFYWKKPLFPQNFKTDGIQQPTLQSERQTQSSWNIKFYFGRKTSGLWILLLAKSLKGLEVDITHKKPLENTAPFWNFPCSP